MVKWGYVIFWSIFLLGIFLLWGFIGGADAENHGKVCDFGIGESLCWKWHSDVDRNGDSAQNINEALGNYFE